MNTVVLLAKVTGGSLMYYGGMAGIGLGVVLLVLCIVMFPKQRKRLLKNLALNNSLKRV